MTIKDLQTILPWTVKYSRDFRSNPQQHKDFAHAITHAMKALGKLSTIVDDLDHRRKEDFAPDKYMADLVVCALRMANTFPGATIDLESAVIDRIETANGVTIKKAE